MKNYKCKICKAELVFITDKTYSKIVDDIRPSFKTLSAVSDGIYSLCPVCDSYALGAELENGYPFFDCNGTKQTLNSRIADVNDEHKLTDILKNGLDIVFCGTAVGNKSAQSGAYYASSSNAFWKVLAQTGMTKEEILPVNYKDLLRYNIGLTDINKTESGMDKDVELNNDTDVAILRYKVQKYSPKILVFTSKEAAKAFFRTNNVQYGLQSQVIGDTKVYVCPSTSGAARGHFDVKYWSELKDLLADS
jgi:TDG/mug DNA glycosylase family protein